MNPLWEFLTVRKEQDLFLREYSLLSHVKDESSWVNCRRGKSNVYICVCVCVCVYIYIYIYIYLLIQAFEAMRNFTFQAKLFNYLKCLCLRKWI